MKIVGRFIISIALLLSTIYGFSIYRNLSADSGADVAPASMLHLNRTLSNELSELSSTRLFDKKVEQFMARWGIEGASFALIRGEELLYAKGYGWADRERGERCGPHNIFRVASLSKLITAVAIMKLCEEGKLTLESKLFGPEGVLSHSFPNYRDKRVEAITIEHLLRHRGGFSTAAGDPLFSLAQIRENLKLDRAVTRSELVNYLLSKRVAFPPGERSAYSNFGYLLLSIAIESLTGMSYWEYIKREILEPNGIFDFQMAKNSYHERYPNEVRYYPTPGDQTIAPFDGGEKPLVRCYGGNNIELLEGAGGWVASPAELLRFITLIDGKESTPDILSKESIEKMASRREGELPIGWIRALPGGILIRSGYFSGSNALIRHDPNGFSWIFLTNSSTWKGGELYRYIDFAIRDAINSVEEWPQRNLFLGGE